MSSILIKLISGNKERGIPCGKYEKEQLYDNGNLIGYKVHAIQGTQITETVTVPGDGSTIYLEQDGVTIDVISWPPRRSKNGNNGQFRAMGDQQ